MKNKLFELTEANTFRLVESKEKVQAKDSSGKIKSLTPENWNVYGIHNLVANEIRKFYPEYVSFNPDKVMAVYVQASSTNWRLINQPPWKADYKVEMDLVKETKSTIDKILKNYRMKAEVVLIRKNVYDTGYEPDNDYDPIGEKIYHKITIKSVDGISIEKFT